VEVGWKLLPVTVKLLIAWPSIANVGEIDEIEGISGITVVVWEV
jgi:hypothetical protein